MKAFIKTAFFLFFSQQCLAQQADLILINGKIFTSDTSALYAEALAIKGDRILAVGKSAAMARWKGPHTKRIDLQGRTVIPGINDAHDHIGYGTPVSRFISFPAPLLQGPSLQQVLDSLAVAAKGAPAGTLIRGSLGLLLLEDSTARRIALDRVTPHHPVILTAPWGHGTLLNTKALEMLGISLTAKDPVGGYYERIKGTGQLSGLLREYAEFGVLRKWYNRLPDSVFVRGFRSYGNSALQWGITSVQNMSTALELEKTVTVFRKAAIPLRIRIIRFPGTAVNGREPNQWSKTYTPSSRLEVSGIKWILDGTPLERDALMGAAYQDREGWKGQLNFPPDTMRKILQEGLADKEQLMLHIVGDSTPRIVLSQMLDIAPAETWKRKRLRFEHADGLQPDQWPAVRRLGIVVVANPSHFMFAEINHTRLGAERSAHFEPLRSLMEAGIPVAFGSDGPNNPFLNIMFAALHPTNPKEAISREQSVIAYTYGSAYAQFRETEKGSLKKGMLADLAVLSQDIFTVPLEALPVTTSVLTIIGGKIAFEDPAFRKNK